MPYGHLAWIPNLGRHAITFMLVSIKGRHGGSACLFKRAHKGGWGGSHQLPALMIACCSIRALCLITFLCKPAYCRLKSTTLQGLDVEFRSLMGELAALQPSNGHARAPPAGAAEVC